MTGELAGAVGVLSASPTMTNLGVVTVELEPGGGLFSLSDQKTC